MCDIFSTALSCFTSDRHLSLFAVVVTANYPFDTTHQHVLISAMTQSKTIALFDVDGTLTVPRNVRC